MTLPTNVDTATVTGTFLGFNGVPATGTVTFFPVPPAVTDPSAGVVMLPTPVVATLDAGGAFSVELVATDDTDLNPTDWAYGVALRLSPPASPDRFLMYALSGSTTDLSAAMPVIDPVTGVGYIAGIQGPPGEGVPPGGAVGEVLAKLSATDSDTVWTAASAPGLHATTHATGGTDPVSLTGAQVSTFGTAAPGVVPSSGGGAVNFLRADGTWAAPPGSGGVSDGDKGDIVVTESGTVWTFDSTVVTTTARGLLNDTTTAAMRTTLGLGSVDNTADTAKPISTAQAAEFALKADKATTITPVAPLTGGGSLAANRTLSVVTFDTDDAGVVPASGGGTTNFLRADGTWAAPAGGGTGVTDGDKGDIVVSSSGATWLFDTSVVTAAAKTVLDDATTTDMRTTLGLGNVDNTSDASKPVSTATTTALGLKADKATTLTPTAPLTGGGDLSTNRTVAISAFAGSAAGAVPVSSGGTNNFLRADGSWAMPPGGGGSTGHASFVYNATLTAAPATTQIRMNSATQTAATTLWVSEEDFDGLDVTIGLAKILAGHQIYIQDYDDASKWIKYNVTAAVDSGAYFTFTIAYHSGPAGLPTGSGAAGRVELQGIAPGSVGVPPGGTTGQALTKTNSTDYTVEWASVQPLDSDLTTIASLTATTDNIIQSVAGAWASRTPAQVKTVLAITEADVTGLVTDLAGKQPLDTDLTTIAGLTATTGNMILSASSAWTSATPATVKTALSLDNVSNTSDATKDAATATLTNKTLTDPKLVQTINAQTGTSYTLVLTDASKIITLSNASAITLTVPTNASVAFPVGTSIDLIQLAAGQFTVTGAGPPTISKSAATAKSRAQYSVVTIIKTATDVWIATGDLAAS